MEFRRERDAQERGQSDDELRVDGRGVGGRGANSGQNGEQGNRQRRAAERPGVAAAEERRKKAEEKRKEKERERRRRLYGLSPNTGTDNSAAARSSAVGPRPAPVPQQQQPRYSEIIRQTNAALANSAQQNVQQTSFREQAVDHGDLWGMGDETDEHMQRLLENSYRANHRSSAAEEEAALEAAIKASLESSGENEMLEEAIKASLERGDSSASGSAQADQHTSSVGGGDDDDDDDVLIQIQFSQILENYPAEVASETFENFERMKRAHQEYGCEKPTLDKALDKALKDVKRKQDEKDQKEKLDLEFIALQGEYPADLLHQARGVYDEMIQQHRDQGGLQPSIEYAISVAENRKKEQEAERERERQQKIQQEERIKREQDERAEQERLREEQERRDLLRNESREARAARIAAKFEAKKSAQGEQ